MTKKKGDGFCQRKLKELLAIDNSDIEMRIKSVFSAVIQPWLDKVIAETNESEIVQTIEQYVKEILTKENDEFNKFILQNIKDELANEKLEQSWFNYSGEEIKKDKIAAKILQGDYQQSLLKIQDWAKNEHKNNVSPDFWPFYFSRIQKIAGWVVLTSINSDWWINNQLSFTYGAKNQGHVNLSLKEEHYSYSEVVVSRALKKSAEYYLDPQHHLIPANKEFSNREGNDFVFDSTAGATLESLLIPIITDLRKAKPVSQSAEKLFKDLLVFVSMNTEKFYYLVTQDYLKQLKSIKASEESEQSVLEVINQKLKGKIFFIAIETNQSKHAPQITDNFMNAIALMENILVIDK